MLEFGILFWSHSCSGGKTFTTTVINLYEVARIKPDENYLYNFHIHIHVCAKNTNNEMLVIQIEGALLWIKSGEVSNLLSLYICIYCTKCLDLFVKGIFPHSSANFLYRWKKLYSRHIHCKKINFYTPVPAPRRVRLQNPTTETILTKQRAYLKFREI